MSQKINWTPKIIGRMYIGRRKGKTLAQIAQELRKLFPEINTLTEKSLIVTISKIFTKQEPKKAFRKWLTYHGYSVDKLKLEDPIKTVRISSAVNPEKMQMILKTPDKNDPQAVRQTIQQRIILSLLQKRNNFPASPKKLYALARKQYSSFFSSTQELRRTLELLISLGFLEKNPEPNQEEQKSNP